MCKGLPSLKRLLTVSLCTVLCTALMCTLTPSTHAWPKGGGGGGGNGGGGNGGGGEDPPPSNLPEYTIEFIGDGTTTILGMNDFGDLVGGTSWPATGAWAFLQGVGMLDLNVVANPDPGVWLYRAHDINNYGEIVVEGFRDVDGDGQDDEWANYRLTLDGNGSVLLLEELGTLSPNGPEIDFRLGRINDDGDIFGTERDATNTPTSILWSSDSDGDGLLDAVALPSGVRFYRGGGITNRAPDGTVQITSDVPDVYSFWRWTGDLSGNGVLENLGPDTNSGDSGGYDINEFGDVVGNVSYWGPGFRYTDDGGFEEVGQLVTNPKPGEWIRAHAWGINNNRETVGWAAKGKTKGTNEQTIFIHHDDFGSVDIAPLISNWSIGLSPPGSSEDCLHINDAGQIAGNAAEGAFILTPVAP